MPTGMNEPGLLTTTRGFTITQLPDRFPILKNVYTNFEYTYATDPGVQFSKRNWMIPIVLVTVYMAGCFIGRNFIFGSKENPKRKPLNLRNELAAWNLLLCVFSLMGAFRTVPHLLFNMFDSISDPAKDGLVETLCLHGEVDWGDGATGLWVQLFVYSKIPELIDTFFIVVRQTPLIFLHWYHHVTVLLYCWHSYATEAPQALYFVAMNFSVHGIMYGYYCLMAVAAPKGGLKKFLKSIAGLITTMQISQMVVGIIVQVSSMYVFYTGGRECALSEENLIAGAIMYGSYFLLFLHFFLGRYFPALVGKGKAKKN